MLRKKVKYTDFDGNERTETLMFNLTKTEALDIAFDLPDDVKAELQGIDDEARSQEAAVKILSQLGDKKIFAFIKDFVLKSYGIKSEEDETRFIKKDENGRPLANAFEETLAFDAIITELMTSNETAAMEFVNAVLPAGFVNATK